MAIQSGFLSIQEKHDTHIQIQGLPTTSSQHTQLNGQDHRGIPEAARHTAAVPDIPPDRPEADAAAAAHHTAGPAADSHPAAAAGRTPAAAGAHHTGPVGEEHRTVRPAEARRTAAEGAGRSLAGAGRRSRLLGRLRRSFRVGG